MDVLFTMGEKISFGDINGPEISYELSFDKEKGQFINDLLTSNAQPDLSDDMRFPPLLEQSPSTDRFNQQLTARNNGGIADITLLVVYNTEFRVGFGDPQARIQQAVEFTNQALTNSNIDAQFRLVSAVEIGFSNTLDVNTILSQATGGQGSFVNLATLRNSVGADMVSTLSFQSNGSSANGVAWVNGTNPNFAFSSSRLSIGCCNSVFAHELGHNLGSGHERDSVLNSTSSCSGGFNGFSCGYGSQQLNFGTMMSRVGNRINRYSNPDQICRGIPCGIPQGQGNAADNQTSFNISAFLIENFREDVFLSPPPSSSSGQSNIAPIIPLLLSD